jgi:hypothetical protein
LNFLTPSYPSSFLQDDYIIVEKLYQTMVSQTVLHAKESGIARANKSVLTGPSQAIEVMKEMEKVSEGNKCYNKETSLRGMSL